MRQFTHAAIDARQSAKNALADSDVTLLRAIEEGKAVPAAWKTYRAALRAVARDGGALPKRPAYP